MPKHATFESGFNVLIFLKWTYKDPKALFMASLYLCKLARHKENQNKAILIRFQSFLEERPIEQKCDLLGEVRPVRATPSVHFQNRGDGSGRSDR